MTAQTLMNPDLVVVRATDTVADAAELILKHHLRHLPVVDEAGRYLGTFGIYSVLQLTLPTAVLKHGLKNVGFVAETTPDLAQRLRRRGQEPVSQWLSKDPVAHPDTPAMTVIQMILQGHTSVPVVDRSSQRLEGIISSWSVLERLTSEAC
ncbi:MAG TPA: CBS domain-containing protein [Candidatus Competibacter sp.]|nr:hypothetical protein [Candidatus Competibacteraceae bacterium]HRE54417.1 CBS domain-containing protein [Candidatus Competibacter sp.]HUM94261.1 CBS domain-containing protein [Candidatus Competibacter sp.]